MHYPDGSWSIHGKGEQYCDPEETFLTEEEMLSFIWKQRSSVNQVVKELAAVS